MNIEKQKKNKKRKKILLGSIGLGSVLALGTTIAYFTTSNDFINIFNSARYEAKIIEDFTSPTDWTPGTTTDKTIVVKNNGSINMAVRASYTEKWENANGQEISLKDSNNNTASIINFNDGWTKADDGYYYYGSKESMTRLLPNETSTSFISGVTFNSNIEATLTKTESEDKKTITFTSTGTGYDNAKYTLTITIDTIQYDQAKNVW